MKLSTGAGGLATLGLIGAAIGVGISSGGALIAVPLVICVCIVTFLVFCVSLFACMPAIGIGIVIWSGSCLDCIASGACNHSLTKFLISHLTPCSFNYCLLKVFVVVCSNFVSSLFVSVAILPVMAPGLVVAGHR